MPRRVTTKRVESKTKSKCGCCTGLLTLAILIALGVFLAVYLTDAESPADLIPEDFHPGDFIPNMDEFFAEDPFNATTPEDSNRWAGTTGKGGLTLELVNALEEKWYPYFDLAVADWDNGNPDVLTLTTSFDTPEAKCSPIRGKMKVCNGNYGDTKWKGINVVSLINEEIIESSAKMNEFYLASKCDCAGVAIRSAWCRPWRMLCRRKTFSDPLQCSCLTHCNVLAGKNIYTQMEGTISANIPCVMK